MSKILHSLRKSINALNLRENVGDDVFSIEEGEIWITRDGKHQVLVLTKDSLRAENDYPLTGAVVFPENGGDFQLRYKMEYPRFCTNGKFSLTSKHPLDLVQKMV